MAHVDDVERGHRAEVIEDWKADIHHTADGVAGTFVVAAPADFLKAFVEAAAARFAVVARPYQFAEELAAPGVLLERGDHARGYAIVVKREMRTLAYRIAHRLRRFGARKHHQSRIVMNAQMVRLAGAAGEFLHVGHRTIEQAVHRRMQVGQLEQSQREQVSCIGLAGEEGRHLERVGLGEFQGPPG